MNSRKEAARTKALANHVNATRWRQKCYAPSHNRRDDERTNGELITAAMNYLELAQAQILQRDEQQLIDTKRMRPWVPNGCGGTDYGYITNSPMIDMPADWPLPKHAWQPGAPRSNLFNAATMILAELERLERRDRILLGLDKPPEPEKEPVEISITCDTTAPSTLYNMVNTTTATPTGASGYWNVGALQAALNAPLVSPTVTVGSGLINVGGTGGNIP